MKTIFLAAGRSNRMKPLGDKNLLKFCGQPLLIHLLENAKVGGLKNFIVVCNKENKADITKALQEYSFEAEVVIQPRVEEGQGGGVLAGLEGFENEEVFVLGGNDLVDAEIYQSIVKKSADFSGGILAKKVTSYFPGGYLETDSNGVIKSIVEKPGAGQEPSDLVNIVAHFFKSSADLRRALEDIKKTSQADDFYEQGLQKLFTENQFLAVEYDGAWQAIKYPWHVLDMQTAILERQEKRVIKKSAEISEQATLVGDHIVIDEGARIMNNATIISPCYIGKNSLIGQNCLVRGSNIGDENVIGFNSEIGRSWLADKVSTHMAYVGDSVVDSDVNFGAMSVTTNLRLDKGAVKMKIKDELVDTGRDKLGCVVGKGTQIGSGAKILPGRKLHSGQLVEPNGVVK